MARELNIWMNGELVGLWRINRGEHELTYVSSWLTSKNKRPLSLSLPLRPGDEPYRGPTVHNFFDNLLPDNDDLRKRIQARFGIRSTDAFDLLSAIGRECVGALQILPADEEPPNPWSLIARKISRQDLEERLLNFPVMGLQGNDDEFRISLAGAQEKTALLFREGSWWIPSGVTPTTHIFKLPISAADVDLSTSVENEWLCSRVLHALGVPVAHTELGRFGQARVLIVERFDRRWAQHGRLVRLHQEDLAQATGTPSGMKYESDGGPGITKLMTLLRGSTRAASDRVDFFRTLLLQWLLCAIDGHAKNFSVHLEAGGSFRLAPRYDVISVYPALGRGSRKLAVQRVKMAMALWGENRHYRWNEIRRHHFLRTAKDCGLAEAPRLLDELLAAVPQAMDLVASELPSDFPESVSEPIFDGVAKACQMLQA